METFVREIQLSSVDSPTTKASDEEILFSFISAWTYDWTNKRDPVALIMVSL